jgi:transketolase
VTDAAGPRQGAVGDDADLEALARRGRLLVVESVARAGAGHIGGPLSAMDLLIALYFRVLRIRPDEPAWPERDRFVLSKGHASIGLYTAMALRGYLPVEDLATFDTSGSRLQVHPDMTRLPGLDTSTGSLGQGISIAVGMALGARRKGIDNHTWVLVGDGELQEGQAWEAIPVAARYGLGNLALILDWNGMQQYGWPLPAGTQHRGDRADPWADMALGAAFRAFGWRVLEIDGHDMHAIVGACDEARAGGRGDAPTAILARTIKGRGFSFTEGVSEWHSRVATAAEVEAARAEQVASGDRS